MFTTDDPATYLERAEMHEQLASATGDAAARKMHQAMAEGYRRKAMEAESIHVMPPPQADRLIKLNVAAS